MTGGPSTYLIDTNVLVYAYDASEHLKQERARQLLARLEATRTGRLSTQILGEFYNTLTKKLRPTIPAADAEERVQYYVAHWPILSLTAEVVLGAIRVVRHRQLSYWDALILSTAVVNGIETVLTEDLQDGQVIEGVRIVNPFTPSFDLASLSST